MNFWGYHGLSTTPYFLALLLHITSTPISNAVKLYIFLPFQIDESVISVATDLELQPYLPSYGDRIAVKAFSQQLHESDTSVREDGNKRTSLLEKIRAKCHNKSAASKKSETNKTNSTKDFRRIDLGWIHEGIQVRAKQGGGTRKLNIHKDTSLSSILESAKSLFFPEGQSPKGNIKEVQCDICDFSCKILDTYTTSKSVKDLYDETKLAHMRLYLSSRKLNLPQNKRLRLEQDLITTDALTREDDETLPDILPLDILEKAMADIHDNNSAIPDFLDLVDQFSPSNSSTQDSSSTTGLPDTSATGALNTVVVEAPITPTAVIVDTILAGAPLTPTAVKADTMTAEAPITPTAVAANTVSAEAPTTSTAVAANTVIAEDPNRPVPVGHLNDSHEIELDFSRQGTVHELLVHRGNILKELKDYFMTYSPTARDSFHISIFCRHCPLHIVGRHIL